MTDSAARLQRLLGGAALAGLRLRLRRHFERGAELTGAGPRLGGLSAAEHAALATLMGSSPHFTASMQVDIAAIDAALQRAGIAASLRAALEQLDGPITHLATARAAAQMRWSGVLTGCVHPGLAQWLALPAGLGLLKRLARQDAAQAANLIAAADAVLQRLPAAGITRAELAAQTLGDAHALDTGRATATLVLAAWRLAQQVSEPDAALDLVVIDEVSEAEARGDVDVDVAETETEAEADAPAPAAVMRRDAHAREVWANAGVLVNELARPALFLNLPLHTDTLNTSALAAAGEPTFISLRQLLRAPPAWAVHGRTVFVCENPNLVAMAADRWGARCAPLVCTEGMPAAAQRVLLGHLAACGARLRYHGDFDWPGVLIANHVLRVHGATPWRIGAGDYLAALEGAARPGQRLRGAPVTASWDAALTTVMQFHDMALAEEGLAASLLDDLGPSGIRRTESVP